MTGLLMKQARMVAPGVSLKETSLFIVGHGTGLNENSAVAAKLQVKKISETSEYAEVLSAYMEEAPLISEWDKLASQPNVIVVPFFISDGLHSYQDIPVLLGIAEDVGPAASQRLCSCSVCSSQAGKDVVHTSGAVCRVRGQKLAPRLPGPHRPRPTHPPGCAPPRSGRAACCRCPRARSLPHRRPG
jgi:sirohydrochlorin ferrochelatase